jgi:hypothetical protein
LNKPTDDECRRCGKMWHWARECRSKPKKEQAHVAQDEEEGPLLLMAATLTRPKVSLTPGYVVDVTSSREEIELKEGNVYTHLDEEKEHDAAMWVLDTGATNHMFWCQASFMKLNTAVLGIVRFSDDSVARIEGRGSVMFMCKNGES